jgi:hypothetical protein
MTDLTTNHAIGAPADRDSEETPTMKKTLIALAAATAIAAATVAVPDTANARHRGWHTGATVAGAIIGGAIIAGALAPRYRPYTVVEGYDPYPAYYAAPPVDCPGGYWARQCRATDAWGNCVRASKPRFFCPAGY